MSRRTTATARRPLARHAGRLVCAAAVAALAVSTGCAQDMPAETPNLETPGPPLPPVSSAPSSSATATPLQTGSSTVSLTPTASPSR